MSRYRYPTQEEQRRVVTAFVTGCLYNYDTDQWAVEALSSQGLSEDPPAWDLVAPQATPEEPQRVITIVFIEDQVLAAEQPNNQGAGSVRWRWNYRQHAWDYDHRTNITDL